MANVVKIVVDAVDKTKKGLTTPIKSVKDLRAAVDNLKPAFKAAALAGTAAFAAFVKSSTSAAIEMTRIRNAMFAATGSAEGVAKGLDDVREISDRLGLSLVDTARGYSKLSAASKGTALEGEKAVDILEGVATAASALSLSADDTAGALRAVEQIISKGKVQAEELRGQLGERLPGAFQIAARGMGITTQELNKMLERGEVLSDDFLPKFAAELKRTFGDAADVASQSIVGNMNRMENAMFDLRVVVGNSLLPVFNDMIVSIVENEKEFGTISATANTVADTLSAVFRAGAGVSAVFKLMGGIIAAEADFITQYFVGMGATIKAIMTSIKDVFVLAAESLKSAAKGEFAEAAEHAKNAVSQIGEGFTHVGKESLKQFEILKQNSKSAVEGIEADAQRVRDAFMGAGDGIAAASGKGGKAGVGGTPTTRTGSSSGETSAFAAKVTAQYNQITKTKLELINIEHEAQKEAARKEVEDFGERLRVMAELAVIYHAKREELREEEKEREKEANEFIKALNEQARLGDLDWLAQERQIAEDDHRRNIERIQEIGAEKTKQREMERAAEAAHEARLEKLKQDAKRQEFELNDERRSHYQSSLGRMAQASAVFFGQQSAAFKAFAISEAIINTYRGATRAYADHPWPLNFAIAASTIAAGLANVATISGVAHGGIAEVPSDQTFLLKKGERVLSPDQNSDFVDFMEGGGGGASNIELTINLDGDPLWRGLAKASRDGRATISARAIV